MLNILLSICENSSLSLSMSIYVAKGPQELYKIWYRGLPLPQRSEEVMEGLLLYSWTEPPEWHICTRTPHWRKVFAQWRKVEQIPPGMAHLHTETLASVTF